jgi:type IV secretory pathway VirB2 component (pilin)
MKLNLIAEKMTHFALAVVAAYTFMLMPTAALATAAANPLGDTLCNVVDWFQGPIGSGIATLAIIVIGVGALMGKVSWGMAIIVGLGVGIIFGAPAIVDMISGGAGTGCP